jgi:cell division protein ZapA (FtsZ GTPase activity inhibitor)
MEVQMARQGAQQGTLAGGQTSLTTGSVQIEVGGQKLSLRSDKDPDLVRDMAAYLDDKVTALQKSAPSVSLDKLLMLAALTITEELFDARATNKRLRKDVERRVERALEAVAAAEAELEA